MNILEVDRLMSPYGLLSADKIEASGKDAKQIEAWCLQNPDLGDAQWVLNLNRLFFKRPTLPLAGTVSRLKNTNRYMGWIDLNDGSGKNACFNGEGGTETIGTKCTDAVLSMLGDKLPEQMRWMTVHRLPTDKENHPNQVVENWSFSLDNLTWNSKVVEISSRAEVCREDFAVMAILQGVQAYMVSRLLV